MSQGEAVMFSPSVEVKLRLLGRGQSLLVVLNVAAETAATQRISNRAFISDRFIICLENHINAAGSACGGSRMSTHPDGLREGLWLYWL
jgi:hypothetical protein